MADDDNVIQFGKHQPQSEVREVLEGIDGAALLDELQSTLTRYVAFGDEHSAAAVALWIAVTHALPAFECAPRLVITSPQKRCAKSRLLDLVSGTCHRPLASVNATVPAIFRSINEDHPPTLIIDEADTLFGSRRAAENNEDLRALLNAGYQRGRPALRCVGPSQIPCEFPTFAQAALAGIGALPDTIVDRAVNITMRRRAPSEQVSQFRSRRDGPILEKLRARLAEWASWNLDLLTGAEPEMPVTDRAADLWEPLVAIGDMAGSHWPQTARSACKALVAAAEDADEERSLPTRLLSDIRDIFVASTLSFLPSNQLVVELRRIEEAPWNDFDLTRSKLAVRLNEFGIRTRHNPSGTARGYRLEDFTDTFRRYMRQEPSETSEPQVRHEFPSDVPDVSGGSKRQTDTERQKENTSSPANLTFLTVPDACTAGFMPPTGPGRCDACSHHVDTQGHAPGCSHTRQQTGRRHRREPVQPEQSYDRCMFCGGERGGCACE